MNNPPNFETWLQLGAPLVANHKNAKWALGEWLLQSYVSRAGFWPPLVPGFPPGLWVQQAAVHYGYAHGTFLEFMRVADVFPAPTRVGGLSWHHHQAVAAIADPKVRSEWLHLAQSGGWSSKELQQKVSLTKAGLTMANAIQLASLAEVLRMSAGEVQTLIVQEFLRKDDETLSNFVFKHRQSFEASGSES